MNEQKLIPSPTEWCRKLYDKALEDGRRADADAYLELFRMWQSRGM